VIALSSSTVSVCSDSHKEYNISSMPVSRLSALEHVQQIQDYLLVNVYNPEFTSLWFLRNLRIIRGLKLYK